MSLRSSRGLSPAAASFGAAAVASERHHHVGEAGEDDTKQGPVGVHTRGTSQGSEAQQTINHLLFEEKTHAVSFWNGKNHAVRGWKGVQSLM